MWKADIGYFSAGRKKRGVSSKKARWGAREVVGSAKPSVCPSRRWAMLCERPSLKPEPSTASVTVPPWWRVDVISRRNLLKGATWGVMRLHPGIWAMPWGAGMTGIDEEKSPGALLGMVRRGET